MPNDNDSDIVEQHSVASQKTVAKEKAPRLLDVNNEGYGSSFKLEAQTQEPDDSTSDSTTDSASDDENDDTNNLRKFQDGRELSAYEIQRLQRIKRNREYLAQLGLDESTTRSREAGPKTHQRPRKIDYKSLPTRTIFSRRSKVSSARHKESGESATTDTEENVIKTTDHIHSEASNFAGENANADSAKTSIEIGNLQPPDQNEFIDNLLTDTQHNDVVKRKKDSKEKRLDVVVYKEMCRIRSHKNQVMKDAERLSRLAEKELKLWKKIWEKWKAKEMRRELQQERERKLREDEEKKRLEVEKLLQKMEHEKSVLGCTLGQLLYDVDTRKAEIVAAVKAYDDATEKYEMERESHRNQVKAERLHYTLDSFDRYSTAMKSAVSLLNSELLESIPKGRTVSNRNSRNSPKNLPEWETISCPEHQPDVLDRRSVQDSLAGTKTSNHHEVAGKTNIAGKRRAPQVGGLISAAFASKLDRVWLSHHKPSSGFDPSFYVPQVGDRVLYYIVGHKRHLDLYPDELGKKTRRCTRVPIWDRAKQELADNEQLDASAKPSKFWCTSDWIRGIEQGICDRYPLLCLVEKTQIEFPPFSKHVATMQSKAKDPCALRLRLEVTLRPLCPLTPPRLAETGMVEDIELLPPSFCVVMFPSTLEPFLVPFSWAYAVSHSMTLGKLVNPSNSTFTEGRVDGFSDSSSDALTWRLEKNVCFIKRALSRFANSRSETNIDERELLNKAHVKVLSEQDLGVVLDVFLKIIDSSVEPQTQTDKSIEQDISLIDLVRSSLPQWDGVTVTNVQDDKKQYPMPAWTLKDQETFSFTPWQIRDHSFYLEESLRSSIEAVVCDVIDGDESSYMFLRPVTEKEAPQYYCAVPCGMSLSLIQKRLQATTGNLTHGSYYRGVGSILSDVQSILGNCILYNNPNSEIVNDAASLVAELRSKITRAAQVHHRDVQDALQRDQERRSLALQVNGQNVGLKDLPAINHRPPWKTLTEPFSDYLNREWIASTTQPIVNGVSSDTDYHSDLEHNDKPNSWIPQVGDEVLYLPNLHRQFVEGHFPSLESYQCLVPLIPESSEATGSVEHQGEILWTRWSFPKVVSTTSRDDAATFLTSSPLLCLGVKLVQAEGIVEVYWRPCLLNCDSPGNDSTCPACGLSAAASFLQKAGDFVTILDRDDAENNGSAEIRFEPISRCFSLIKKQCMTSLSSPETITRAYLKAGYEIPETKLDANELPCFEYVFEKSATEDNVSSTLSAVPYLVQSGILPSWLNVDGRVDEKVLNVSETLLPNTKLCLDFLQLRLRNRFYRRREALASDIIEAFLSVVFSLIVDATRRRKFPVKIKHVAKLVVSKNDDADSLSVNTGRYTEAHKFASAIRRIRDVYALALVSVSNTSEFEIMFGLKAPPFRYNDDEENLVENLLREESRRKISSLLAAIDEYTNLNRFGRQSTLNHAYPKVRLKVVCNGKTFKHKKEVYVSVQTHLMASANGSSVRVEVLCGGKPYEKILDGKGLVSRSPLSPKLITNRFEKTSIDNIPFSYMDCKGNEPLATLLFQKPNCLRACARCQVSGQNFITCRAQLGHSNQDYDWFASLGGVGGVNGLLYLLRTGKELKHEEGKELKHEETDQSTQLDLTLNVEASPTKIDCLPHNDESEDKLNNLDDTAEDPTESFNNATEAFCLSQKLFEESKRYYMAPIRFSKEFVSGLPLDDEDGHYMYCVICGYIGDLLCCDGCPNVLHAKCIGLGKVPEGEWYCEECMLAASPVNNITAVSTPNKLATSKAENNSSTDDLLVTVTSCHLPFGRLNFDDTRLSKLNKMIEEVREKRLADKKTETSLKPVSNENVTCVGQSIDENTENIGMLQSVSTPDSPRPRKRGRPRKSDVDVVSSSKVARTSIDNPSVETTGTRTANKNNAILKTKIPSNKNNESAIVFVDSQVWHSCRNFQPRTYSHPRRLFCMDNTASTQHKI